MCFGYLMNIKTFFNIDIKNTKAFATQNGGRAKRYEIKEKT